MKLLIDFNLPQSNYDDNWILFIVEDTHGNFSVNSIRYLLSSTEDKPQAESHLELGSLRKLQDEWLSYSEGDLDWEEFKDEFWGRLIEDIIENQE